MKATLQYYANAAWGVIGTITLNDKKQFSVTPILIENRLGINEVVAYKVKCACTVKDISSYLTPSSIDEYPFRLASLEAATYLALGTRKYDITYDQNISKVSMRYQTINIEFIITVANYATYTTFS